VSRGKVTRSFFSRIEKRRPIQQPPRPAGFGAVPAAGSCVPRCWLCMQLSPLVVLCCALLSAVVSYSVAEHTPLFIVAFVRVRRLSPRAFHAAVAAVRAAQR
jgi:hypothetical protein